MRIMAIRTYHKAFIHAVFERHIKLAANIEMAAVTQINLVLRKKILRSGCFVNGVARCACQPIQGMRGTSDIGPRDGLIVAGQTRIDHLLLRQNRKGSDCVFSRLLHMRCARAVAPLAPGAIRRFLSQCDADEVRIFIETGPYVRMTSAANVAANVSTWRGPHGGQR
jgi:hypothetical protein